MKATVYWAKVLELSKRLSFSKRHTQSGLVTLCGFAIPQEDDIYAVSRDSKPATCKKCLQKITRGASND